MTGEDLKEIDIENWELIDENNERTRELLDRCASSIIDISENMNFIKSTATSVNDKLLGLKTIDHFSIWEGKNLQVKFNALTEKITNKSIGILTITDLAKTLVDNYDKVSDSDYNMFADIIMDAEKLGVFWFISELTKESKFDSLGNLLAYGTDKLDGSVFSYGDFPVKTERFILKYYYDWTDKEIDEWLKETKIFRANLGAGTVLVIGHSLIKNAMSHEGEWSVLDKKEAFVNVGKDAVSFTGWTTIVYWLAEAPVGVPVIIASLVSIPTSHLLDTIGDQITGNYEIETFEIDGKTYIVYGNGVGHNGEYDDILREYEKNISNSEYWIDGKPYSEDSYYSILYGSDWSEAVPSSLDYIFSSCKEISPLLDSIRNAGSVEEAQKILLEDYGVSYYYDEENKTELYVENIGVNGSSKVASDLNKMRENLDFNLYDFVAYNSENNN